MTANVQSMFYTGQRPWHGLGTEIVGAATAAQAITAAGLTWSVNREPVFFKRNGALVEIPGKRAIVREDTGAVFGVMGDGYTPIQNHQSFDFFDAIVGEGKAIYHTAGALGNGERVWILAKLPQDIMIDGGDMVEKFLLLSNAHDGTAALRMFFSPIRVVCQNTLNAALAKGQGEGIAIRHTSSALDRVAEARRALGIALKYYDDFGRCCNELCARQITAAALDDYYRTLVPDNAKADNKARTQNIRSDFGRLFRRGKGNSAPGVRGTWWAAYNSITEYADHERSTRGESALERQSNRLESSWFGSGADLKQRAWDVALERVGVKVVSA